MRHGRVNTNNNAMLALVLLFSATITCCAAPLTVRDKLLTAGSAPSRLLLATATPNSTTEHAHVDGLSYLYTTISQTCDPACLERGNCNAEEGRCECPWGYGGEVPATLGQPGQCDT